MEHLHGAGPTFDALVLWRGAWTVQRGAMASRLGGALDGCASTAHTKRTEVGTLLAAWDARCRTTRDLPSLPAQVRAETPMLAKGESGY
jgi:hypothetical protein